jgi:hypothetical protein
VGGARQAAQAAVARHVTRDQHEVRAQLASANATQVLATRLAMARRTQAFDGRLDCLTLSRAFFDHDVRLSVLRPTSPPPPASGNDQSRRIGGYRIEKFNLHADDRTQARVVGGRGEPDSAV